MFCTCVCSLFSTCYTCLLFILFCLTNLLTKYDFRTFQLMTILSERKPGQNQYDALVHWKIISFSYHSDFQTSFPEQQCKGIIELLVPCPTGICHYCSYQIENENVLAERGIIAQKHKSIMVLFRFLHYLAVILQRSREEVETKWLVDRERFETSRESNRYSIWCFVVNFTERNSPIVSF